MRPFEIITVSLVALAWLSRLLPAKKYPRLPLILSCLALLAAVLQIMLEKFRWQMAPACALAVLLCVMGLARLKSKPTTSPPGWGRRARNMLGFALGLALVAVVIALPAVFPVFQFPSPTGPYQVGVTSMTLVDESRLESFSPAPGDKRSVYLQVWYPAQPGADLVPAPPYPKTVTSALSKAFSMPDFAFDHLALVHAHGYSNAPLAGSGTPFPVLVFSHGYYIGFPAQNTVQMEELASHGYIIISIGHAYEALVVSDPQGQAVLGIPPAATSAGDLQKQLDLIDRIKATTGLAREQAAFDFMGTSPAMQDSFQVWIRDSQFVLDQVALMNSGQVGSPFAGRMDLAHIGLFGMSFGGAAAFQVCANDARCKSALNMDGFQYGTLLDDRLQAPFMMMYSEANDHINDWALDNQPEPGYSLRVEGSTHLNYSDFNLIGPVLLGKIDPGRMEHIISAYILAFFDQTLKGVPSPLLQPANRDYPQVELRVFSAAPR